MSLPSSVAFVTGAGRGIGKAIALAFAEEGAYLALAARTLSEVEETASNVRDLGGRVLTVAMDVSRRQEVDATVASILAEFGRIDILVNNAAVQPPIGPLWESDPDEWVRTIHINLGGVFLCCRAVVPVMICQGGGKIINLSGGGATSARPYFSAYAASKAAVVRLTETLAQEVKEHNIQVNAIAPGPVSTRMTEQVLAAGTAAGERALGEARRTKQKGTQPQAVTELAVFLASEESAGLTGRLISAVWDSWRTFPLRLQQIMDSDLYTLRRITADTSIGVKS